MPSVEKRTPREVLVWPYGDHEWRLLPDVAGVVPFMEPDDKGRIGPPTSETYDQFLAVVIDTEQAADFLKEAEEDRLPAPERYDMAVAAWKNTMRYPEVENEQAKLLGQYRRHNEVVQAAIQKALDKQKAAEAEAETATEDEPAFLDEG